MRRALILLSLTSLGFAGLPAGAGAQELPPTPPRDQWHAANDLGFDYWSDGSYVRVDEDCLEIEDEQERLDCSLDAFQAKPFVVIAFTDTGINPYHQDFRAPEFTHHPATYIEGFPAGAQTLEVSLDVADEAGYDAAVGADLGTWNSLSSSGLYWIPGTRIIGARRATASSAGPTVILDDSGHGTGVASVAAGRYYGANPEALIVVVEGLGDASLNWAAAQPWIDVVSNSWGPALAGVSTGSVNGTRNATRRGQSILFSSGNGNRNTNSSEVWDPIENLTGVEDPCKCKVPNSNLSMASHNKGPSWIMTVGAASPINGQSHWWHGIPVDVSSFGSKWRAADAFGVAPGESRDFGGTSCASPTTGGVLSRIILEAREALGDTVAGQKAGAVVAQAADGVEPPATGPLADGRLTRLEAEDVLQKSAQPVAFDAEKATWDYAIYPTTPLYFAYQGYGLVDRDTRDRALRVLAGEDPMPDRSEVDAFIETADAARDAVYGPP